VERDDEHHTVFFLWVKKIFYACAFFLFLVDFLGFGHNPEPHLFPAPDCISFQEMHMFIWRDFWGSWRWREVERESACVHVRAYVLIEVSSF
jgi:hypothetical protein